VSTLDQPEVRFVVVISANAEWRIVRESFESADLRPSPFGQWFVVDLDVGGCAETVLFFHGGWGKIAAAASTQYAIDRWAPELLINLGTCGGFEGEIERETVILVERTVVYDIVEQMGDPEAVIAHYTTDLHLAWLVEPHPQEVRRTLLVSGDRDLLAEEIPRLKAEFGAVAGDWESGSIAWVAARNNTPCLILRGVTDLVGQGGGEAYEGNKHVFLEGTGKVMRRLVRFLPAWIARARDQMQE
jgi:adenosylhomocysteine nucleosidase